jgi:hypothetical protein
MYLYIYLSIGYFNNPGWCIGETPYLPGTIYQSISLSIYFNINLSLYLTLFLYTSLSIEQDRKKQLAAKIAASRTMQPSKALWTAGSLREYMGLPMKGLTLAINLEYHNTYFEMISTLGIYVSIYL